MLQLIFLQEEHKMDSQNETAQLRYLEETSIRLRRMDFETMPAEDQQLPVKWNGSDLCRISGKGSVLYRQERVDALGAQDALQAVIDTAKMTSEYMAILETAPLLTERASITGIIFRATTKPPSATSPCAADLFKKTPFLSRSSLRRSTAR